MKKIKNKKILAFFLFIFSFVIATAISYASVDDNVTGWLWGGSDTNLGWISMNGTNITGSTSSYGVNIPEINGSVTGYGWSENMGWIDFGANNCTTSAPGAGQYQASSCAPPLGGTMGVLRSENILTGWARIVGVATEQRIGNSGGASGWIKIVNADIDPNTGNVTGWAWNGGEAPIEELGWIKIAAKIDDSVISCVCGPSGAYCLGVKYEDSCGTTDACTGTKDCSCVPDSSCAADTCEGEVCTSCAIDYPGTKKCPDLNWREVRP